MAREQSAILFRKFLGLNDSVATTSQTMVTNPREPDAGATECIDCLNITTTVDGCIEKVPSFITALETGAPITSLSAGSRLLFSDGTDTREWTGASTIVDRFPAVAGPIAHTPLDVRVSGATKNYKSTNAAPSTATEALVGTTPTPATSMAFAAMPLFAQAFVYNAKMYLVNRTDTRFLQYSEDYAFDLYNLGDSHIGAQFPVLQAGCIASAGSWRAKAPGLIATLHAEGVTVYSGTSPLDFTKRFFPCPVIPGTLFCGFVNKTGEYGVTFLCADGVYFIAHDEKLTNMTEGRFTRASTLNTSYACATVTSDGKYLAFGDQCCVEYDFVTKSTALRDTQSVVAACTWGGTPYFAVGSQIVEFGAQATTTPCSITLPFSDLSARGRKSFRGLYFTGTANGRWAITATDQSGASWSIDRTDQFQNVTGQYIKVPKGYLGNHVSIKVESLSGTFRLEELRAVVSTSERSR